jgi:predicted nucleotidyltransferase
MIDPSDRTIDSSKYLAYWQRAMDVQQQAKQQAVKLAWQEVQAIAQCLRRDFGVGRVVVFGSLVRDRFTDSSDIDVAAEGIAPARYFEAVARVNELSDRWIDLKPLEDLEEHFRQRVLATGVEVDATD